MRYNVLGVQSHNFVINNKYNSKLIFENKVYELNEFLI